MIGGHGFWRSYGHHHNNIFERPIFMYLNKFSAKTMAQLAQCSFGNHGIASRFTDPVEAYYQTIHLRSCHQAGDYVFADGHRVTSAELAELHRCYTGDIVVDGVVHGVMSDLY